MTLLLQYSNIQLHQKLTGVMPTPLRWATSDPCRVFQYKPGDHCIAIFPPCWGSIILMHRALEPRLHWHSLARPGQYFKKHEAKIFGSCSQAVYISVSSQNPPLCSYLSSPSSFPNILFHPTPSTPPPSLRGILRLFLSQLLLLLLLLHLDYVHAFSCVRMLNKQ